eukprot:4196585-Pleurochrysis_carterae.AAC.1
MQGLSSPCGPRLLCVSWRSLRVCVCLRVPRASPQNAEGRPEPDGDARLARAGGGEPRRQAGTAQAGDTVKTLKGRRRDAAGGG